MCSCQFDLKSYYHRVHVKISSSFSCALNSISRGNKCQNHLLTSIFIECLKRKKKKISVKNTVLIKYILHVKGAFNQ